MSAKKKPQKHQNATAWKFDKHKTDPKTKILKNLQIINCCQKCTAVIEWKIKYGKYKTLTQPAKCLECQEKTVKYAYHTRCIPCVERVQRCSKCGDKVSEFVNLPAPTPAAIAKQEAEFQKDIKSLPERRRRTFLRYLERLKKESEGPAVEDGDETIKEGPPTTAKQVDAMAKLADLKARFGRDDGTFDLDDLGDELDHLDDNDEDDFDEDSDDLSDVD